ncbi:MAG: GNAT family N-acetyltransferase [Chloroflexi bacterium]|nr:GNAT family N-acetyltransferase [Chloroflexota bacterium]
MTYELSRGGYVVTTDPSRLDIDYIHAFLTGSYWARGIPRDVVARAIENSLNFGLFEGARQVGFARAITDRAWYAYIADVFVDEAHRGKGLGKLIMEAVTSHPELQNLRRMMLGTADAHGLYRQFGFTDVEKPERWMERGDPAVYEQAAS